MMLSKVAILLLALVFVYGRSTHKDGISLDDIQKLEDEIESISSSLNDLDELENVNDGKIDGDIMPNPGDELEERNDVDEGDPFAQILKKNEEEDSTSFLEEGDIVPNPNVDSGDEYKRNSIHRRDQLWSNRTVPYDWDTEKGKVIGIPATRTLIVKAMDTISKASCIKFRPRTADDKGTYLLLSMRSGCYSYVGKVFSAAQVVSIGQGCEYLGIIMHELLHALGFYHEQSRYDRDDFVRIHWENIRSGKESNFQKKSRLNSHNSGTDYDYDGIMHYSSTSFTKNGQPTITIVPGAKATVIGQRGALSKIDKEQINTLYDCKNKDRSVNDYTDWTSFSPCEMFSSTANPITGRCYKKRLRFCPAGRNQCGSGSSEEVSECSNDECKRDGYWSHWGAYGQCDAVGECVVGLKTRTRMCDSPRALKGGKPCGGETNGFIPCTSVCPTNCTFNDNLCGYTTQGLWKVIKGNTASRGTGPTDDVSGGSRYAYTEVSGQPSNTYSELRSPDFAATEGEIKCLSFYWHMKGANIGTLYVNLTDAKGTNTTLWTKAGDQKSITWTRQKITIAPKASFKIVFGSVSGPSWQGDVAVDQIEITNRDCNAAPPTSPPQPTLPPPQPVTTTTLPPQPVTTLPPPTTTTTTTTAPPPPPVPGTTAPPPPVPATTTTTAPPPPVPGTTTTTAPPPPVPGTTIAPSPSGSPVEFDCDFEDGDTDPLCGMKSTTKLQWTRKVGRATYSRYYRYQSGPLGDRSAERGNYLMIGCRYTSCQGESAVMRTKEFTSGGVDQTLEFYLDMSNNDKSVGANGMGTFDVFLVSPGSKVSLYNKGGILSKTSIWKQINVDINVANGEKFHLEFAAKLGKRRLTNIAIDNIHIFSKSRASSTLPSPTKLDCSFRDGLCSWDNKGKFGFKTIQGKTPTEGTGPTQAASASRRDKYAYIEASSPRVYGDTASIMSPFVNASEPSCLHFYASMHGKNIGFLEVHIITHDENEVPTVHSKEITSPNADVWSEQYIELPVGQKFCVNINATVGEAAKGDIAIDNLHVLTKKCPSPADTVSTLKMICDFENNNDCDVYSKQFKVEKATNGNHYVTAKKPTHLKGASVRLRIPVPSVAPNGGCLSFKYMMRGGRYGAYFHASLYYLKRYGTKTYLRYGRSLGSINDRPESSWMTAQYNLPVGPGRSNYTIGFFSSLRRGRMTEISFDDFELSDGFCPYVC